jgi:hypothetical protein
MRVENGGTCRLWKNRKEENIAIMQAKLSLFLVKTSRYESIRE